jgi:hypothetical protein
MLPGTAQFCETTLASERSMSAFTTLQASIFQKRRKNEETPIYLFDWLQTHRIRLQKTRLHPSNLQHVIFRKLQHSDVTTWNSQFF